MKSIEEALAKFEECAIIQGQTQEHTNASVL